MKRIGLAVIAALILSLSTHPRIAVATEAMDQCNAAVEVRDYVGEAVYCQQEAEEHYIDYRNAPSPEAAMSARALEGMALDQAADGDYQIGRKSSGISKAREAISILRQVASSSEADEETRHNASSFLHNAQQILTSMIADR